MRVYTYIYVCIHLMPLITIRPAFGLINIQTGHEYTTYNVKTYFVLTMIR